MTPTLNIADIVIIFTVFWGPVLLLFILNEVKKQHTAIRNGTWCKNDGIQPALFNVDVVFENGKSKWNVPAKSLNWKLRATSNPIRKFRIAEAI